MKINEINFHFYSHKEMIRFTLLPLDQLHTEEGVDFVFSVRDSPFGPSDQPQPNGVLDQTQVVVFDLPA